MNRQSSLLLNRYFYYRMIPLLIVFLPIVATPCCISQSQEPACPPSRESNRYGVVEQLGWGFLYTPVEIDRVLKLLYESGIGWVRLNWTWKDMQREPGPFIYEHFDIVAQMAAKYDIKLLAILVAVPPWASTAPEALKAERGDLAPVDRYRPADLSVWLTYVRNVVERYDGDGLEDAPGSPRIGYWEVWNEPNLAAYWPPAVDVAEYVEFLRQTHDAIVTADTTATVVLGGLAGNGVRDDGGGYLQALYASGAAAYFDVVSVHLYLHPTADSIGQLAQLVAATRSVMDENEDTDKALWLTEIGWSDTTNAWGRPTVTPREIAAWLHQVYTAPLQADTIFWYNLRNVFDGSPEVEHNFGLIYNDFRPKPAFVAYQEVIAGCP